MRVINPQNFPPVGSFIIYRVQYGRTSKKGRRVAEIWSTGSLGKAFVEGSPA